MDIFRYYTERAVEKCPRWHFYAPQKLRKQQNQSGAFFLRHPVLGNVEDNKAKARINLERGKKLRILKVVPFD